MNSKIALSATASFIEKTLSELLIIEDIDFKESNNFFHKLDIKSNIQITKYSYYDKTKNTFVSQNVDFDQNPINSKYDNTLDTWCWMNNLRSIIHSVEVDEKAENVLKDFYDNQFDRIGRSNPLSRDHYIIEDVDSLWGIIKSYIEKRFLFVSYEGETKIKITKCKCRLEFKEGDLSLSEFKEDAYIIIDLVNGPQAFKINSKNKALATDPINVLKMSDKKMDIIYEGSSDLVEFLNRPENEKFKKFSGILNVITSMYPSNNYNEDVYKVNDIFRAYILLMASFPQMELIYKMGMMHIMHSAIKNTLLKNVSSTKLMLKKVEDLIDTTSSEGKKLFKLPGYIINHLNTQKAALEDYLSWTDIYSLTHICQQDFESLINDGLFLNLITASNSYHSTLFYENLLKVLKYGYDLKKLSQYLMKERSDLNTLYDYLTISEFCDLEYELYPRDLQKRHDDLCKYRKDMQDQKTNNYLNQLGTEMSDLFKDKEVDNKTLCVSVPHSIDDFVNEGNRMRNCIGHYYNNVLSGDSIIFFIRKTDDPDSSYISAEYKVRSNHLGQLYYKCNTPVCSKSEQEFANKICKAIKEGINSGAIRYPLSNIA